MMSQKKFASSRFLTLFLTLGIGLSYASLSRANVMPLQNTAPAFIEIPDDLTAVDPKTEVSVRVWLKFQNEEQLTKLAKVMMGHSSAHAQKWLTPAQVQAQFAPSSADLPSLRNYLAAHGLRIESVEPHNLWIAAKGPANLVQKAFTFGLHDAVVDGKLVHAKTADPVLSGKLELISRSEQMIQNVVPEPSPEPFSESVENPNATLHLGSFTHECFHAPEKHDFAAAGSALTASYTGIRFATDPKSENAIALSSCGYEPATIQKAYGLDRLHQKGLDGRGQTIVILNSYGSPSIREDLKAYDKLFGLPEAELELYYPNGVFTGPFSPFQQQWAKETAIDVEIAHAVAPGAKIAVVGSDMDADGKPLTGLAFAVINHLGDVISDSSADPETQLPPAKIALMETLFKMAVVQGISVQAASGDDGDYVSVTGYPDVSYPASSPYITGVGGTSLAVHANGSLWFQTGWGNNETELTSDARTPLNPPVKTGTLSKTVFQFGSGGGSSTLFSKAAYQNALPGAQRKIPDIAYLADSFTGAQIILTQYDANGNLIPGQQIVRVQGGTSLSSPMFTALWAISNQLAGHSLGLAAAKIYALPKNAITDIQGVPKRFSKYNTAGVIEVSKGSPTLETAAALAAPQTNSSFLGTLFFSPVIGEPINSSSWYALSFGTDSSLPVTPGWDEVTGLGTPNGEAFVRAAARP